MIYDLRIVKVIVRTLVKLLFGYMIWDYRAVLFSLSDWEAFDSRIM